MGAWKHRLSGVRESLKTALCSFCGPIKVKRVKTKSGYGWRCRTVVKVENKRSPSYGRSGYHYKPKDRPEQPCSICHLNKKLVWDHDHVTGEFRGWICGTCNTGLGMFKDNSELLESAKTYLEKRKPTD
jgi:hypothetical protein